MMKEGGKERGAPGGQKTPQLCHEVNTCWSIFIYPNTCLSSNPIFSESSSLSFSFLGGLLSLVGVHNAPSCVLALYGTYRVHAKKMKSGQGVEGVYWVMSWAAPRNLTGLRFVTVKPRVSHNQESLLRMRVRSVVAGCRSLS